MARKKVAPAPAPAPAPVRNRAATMASINARPVPVHTTQPISGLASLVRGIVALPVAQPAAIKRPAVQYTNGVAPNAPPNAPVVQLAGHNFTGKLPPTNPATRGIVGGVGKAAAKAGKLTLGNYGKAPRSAHGMVMWQAVVAALASGPQSPAALAAAAGSGGGAFIAYCCKNGWLTAA